MVSEAGDVTVASFNTQRDFTYSAERVVVCVRDLQSLKSGVQGDSSPEFQSKVIELYAHLAKCLRNVNDQETADIVAFESSLHPAMISHGFADSFASSPAMILPSHVQMAETLSNYIYEANAKMAIAALAQGLNINAIP